MPTQHYLSKMHFGCMFLHTSKGSKTVAEKVATTRTENGHK